MKIKPNSIHKTYNLDEDAIKLIEEGATMNGVSNSEFIELLARNWDSSINPAERLKLIKQEKALLMERIAGMEEQETKLTDDINKIENWRRIKHDRKSVVIKNLVRIILEGRYEDAEQIAKIQGISLGMTATQLLSEATYMIKEKGI
jgi:hypothetical protein